MKVRLNDLDCESVSSDPLTVYVSDDTERTGREFSVEPDQRHLVLHTRHATVVLNANEAALVFSRRGIMQRSQKPD